MAPTTEIAPAPTRVVALRPLYEGGRTYAPEEEFGTPVGRAAQLQQQGLVRIVDPSAPPPGSKIQAAREAAGKLSDEATARNREQAAIREEVQRLEAKVGALRGALSVAEGLDVVRTTQDALAEAERDLEARRTLLANVAQRTRESASRVQAALKVLKNLEDRIAWLKDKAIPTQTQAVVERRAKHAELLHAAEGYVVQAVKPAEAQLQKFQEELAAIGG